MLMELFPWLVFGCHSSHWAAGTLRKDPLRRAAQHFGKREHFHNGSSWSIIMNMSKGFQWTHSDSSCQEYTTQYNTLWVCCGSLFSWLLSSSSLQVLGLEVWGLEALLWPCEPWMVGISIEWGVHETRYSLNAVLGSCVPMVHLQNHSFEMFWTSQSSEIWMQLRGQSEEHTSHDKSVYE